MGGEYATGWHDAAASSLRWWQDAGVDVLVGDDPRDWLAVPVAPKRAAAARAEAPPAVALPDTLDAFVAWRMGADAPEVGWLTPRIAPAGTPGALMILTDMPEAEDADTPLTGAPGRLLDNILAAIGASRESAYLAALAWARPLTGQIAAEQAAELARLAAHHVRLAAPERLLILGGATSRALATANDAETADALGDINRVGGSLAVAIDHPRFLLARPAAKAETWKRLLHFTRGTSE
jgi:uracil-DNA glycosylase